MSFRQQMQVLDVYLLLLEHSCFSGMSALEPALVRADEAVVDAAAAAPEEFCAAAESVVACTQAAPCASGTRPDALCKLASVSSPLLQLLLVIAAVTACDGQCDTSVSDDAAKPLGRCRSLVHFAVEALAWEHWPPACQERLLCMLSQACTASPQCKCQTLVLAGLLGSQLRCPPPALAGTQLQVDLAKGIKFNLISTARSTQRSLRSSNCHHLTRARGWRTAASSQLQLSKAHGQALSSSLARVAWATTPRKAQPRRMAAQPVARASLRWSMAQSPALCCGSMRRAAMTLQTRQMASQRPSAAGSCV